MIRKARPQDAGDIASIYNYYVLNSTSTFEGKKVEVEEMERRIRTVGSRFPWIIFEANREIKGYAYAIGWKPRQAYRHTVETSVYLKHGESGRGIGSLLCGELIDQLSKANVHALISGISLPNEASIALHEKLGFKKIGQFKEVGFKFNRWIDVGYWELILDRNISK